MKEKITWLIMLMYNKFLYKYCSANTGLHFYILPKKIVLHLSCAYSTSSEEHATHNLTETMYAYYVEVHRILILHIAIKFANSTFSLVR